MHCAGLEPGSVVITEEAVDGLLRPYMEVVIISEFSFPCLSVCVSVFVCQFFCLSSSDFSFLFFPFPSFLFACLFGLRLFVCCFLLGFFFFGGGGGSLYSFIPLCVIWCVEQQQGTFILLSLLLL